MTSPTGAVLKRAMKHVLSLWPPPMKGAGPFIERAACLQAHRYSLS